MQAFTKMAQDNPDKYPARMGQPWKEEEVHTLLKSIKDNKSHEDIAKEHQRTKGGITAQLSKMAYEYYKNANKSINDIIILTGLSELIITKTIQKYDGVEVNNVKTEKKVMIPRVSLSTFDIQTEIKTIKADMAEMKKDIKELLECLKAVYTFEDA